jgi:RNA polymerase sigma-70 factor (ECF subfamily)
MDDTISRDEFRRLIAALRAGDPEAARRVFDQYGPVIRAAVRRKLHARLRPRFDSLDFVQDVWASVLATPAERYQFDSPTELVAFLSQVANNKVVDEFRYRFQTQKGAISREEPLPTPSDDDSSRTEPPAGLATPSQLAIADEAWRRLVERIPQKHRAILEQLRNGSTYEQIAAETNTSLSTVNRVVRRLKDLSGL